MLGLLFTSLFFHNSLSAIAGNVTAGGACHLSRVHLDPRSHKLVSDCDDSTFCAARDSPRMTRRTFQVYNADLNSDGICQPRGCRKELFPYGYGEDMAIPRLCPHGTFCPDIGSECQMLVQPGGQCELNRDDQCVVTSANLATATRSWSQYFSPPVLCLNQTCVEANATVGDYCVMDSTTHIYPGSDGQQVMNTVIKDNCMTGLYCDSSDVVCHRVKNAGESCAHDRECISHDCFSGLCAMSINEVDYSDLRAFAVMIAMIIFFFYAFAQ